MSLKDKVVLLTGPAEGFGRALALRLAAEGARIVVFVEGESDLEDKYPNVFIYKASFTDADALCGSIERAGSVFGDIDVIITLACIDVFKPLPELETWEFEETMDKNLRTAFILGREFYKERRDRRADYGRMLNVVYTGQEPPATGQEAYAAARGAINSLTKALAASFGGTGVSINCILAQAVESRMKADGYEDLCAAALYLIDPDNKPISGQTVSVDSVPER